MQLRPNQILDQFWPCIFASLKCPINPNLKDKFVKNNLYFSHKRYGNK